MTTGAKTDVQMSVERLEALARAVDNGSTALAIPEARLHAVALYQCTAEIVRALGRISDELFIGLRRL